jgi:AcrR family transcriptional regulator
MTRAPGLSRGKAESNQQHRTRRDLLRAAARLLRRGLRPTMAELAREARVSRATAYRYFDGVDAVLAEAPVDELVPEADQLFADAVSNDPVERSAAVETALHEATYRNGPQLRAMLAHSLTRAAPGGIPNRQNRRGPLIEAALAPARDRFDDDTYRKLCAALALVVGTESMIVLEDVLRIDEASARSAKQWAVKTLVRGALAEGSSAPTAGRPGSRTLE